KRGDLLAGPGVPEADHLILAAAGQAKAIRAETDARNRGVMSADGKKEPARHDIPEAHGSIDTGAGQKSSVRAERNFVHLVFVPIERAHRSLGADVPKSDRAIGAGTGKSQTVRAEAEAADAALPGKARQLLAIRHVPETHQVVFARAGQ